VLECVLGGDGLGWAVGDDGAFVDATGKLIEALTIAPEAVFEDGGGEDAEAADGADAQLGEVLFRDFAYAGDASNGERGEECLDLFRLDDEEAIGFAPVRGDFGEEFVGGDSSRGREIELVEDLLADGARDSGGSGQAGFVSSDVEVGFVERERFDEVSVAVKDFADAAGDGAVTGKVGRNENSLGAKALSADGGHGGADAEGAGLVGGGANDGTIGFPGDDDGASAQARVVALLDRSIECVHIYMDDFAGAHREYGIPVVVRDTAL